MEQQPHRVERPRAAQPEKVVVDLAEYCDLVVSRRSLKRIAGRPGCLVDADSNEVFRPGASLSLVLRVTVSA